MRNSRIKRLKLNLTLAIFVGVFLASVMVFAEEPLSEPIKAKDSIKQKYVEDEIIVKFKDTTAQVLESEIVQKRKSLKDVKLAPSLERLNKKYKVKEFKQIFPHFKKNEEKLRVLRHKDNLKRKYNIEQIRFTKKEERLLKKLRRAPKDVKRPALDKIYKLTLEEGQSVEEAVAEYSGHPDVEFAQPNYIYILHETPLPPRQDFPYLPNDHYIEDDENPEHWRQGSWEQDFPDLWGLKNIQAIEAWNIFDTDGNGAIDGDERLPGEDVVVAVIDTGVDYNHEDFFKDENGNGTLDPGEQYNIWINEDDPIGDADNDGDPDDDGNGYVDDVRGYDFSDGDNEPIDDEIGHGTHVAGTIAAVGDNEVGIAGVAYGAKIMPVKIFPNATSEVAAQGIRYAAFNGADVLSNSWGPDPAYGLQPSDPTLEAAIDDAYDLPYNCVVVFSAGNSGDDVANWFGPNYPKTIAVAATDYNNNRASFSCWGDEIDVAAPGVSILSLRANGVDPYGDRVHIVDNKYYYADGTSMACPHVAGLAALILSNYSILTNEEVRQAIRDSADDFGDPGFDIYFGYGRINAYKAALQTPNSYGRVKLDRAYYSALSEVGITVLDTDLNTNSKERDTVTIEIHSTTEATPETVLLTEIEPNANIFQGSILLELSSSPIPDDGTLQVQHNDIITAMYLDTSPEGIREATALVDAQRPIISSVRTKLEILISGEGVATITWQTDEPSTSKVYYGTSIPLSSSVEVSDYVTDHVVVLTGLDVDTAYYFAVESQDSVRNTTYDDNSGSFYQFTLISPEIEITPLSLHFETLEYAIEPLIQTFTISNTAQESCDLLFEITPSKNWITVSLDGGRIPTGTPPIDIELTIDPKHLEAGVHTGDITIHNNSSLRNPTVVHVAVTALPAPAIRYRRYHIIDDWSGRSYMCNGDKHFNPGERVELQIEIENLGSLSAKGASAKLSFATPDPHVTILDDNYNVVNYYIVEWGDIAANAIRIMPKPFLIKANDDAPDYHVVNFALEVTDIDGHIWYEEFPIGLIRWSGISAASDIQLDRSETYLPHLPQARISSDENGNVYVVWNDECNGMDDIYFNYSRDFGVTWQINDIRLDTNAPGAANSGGAQISCDNNGGVYVVWADDRNGKSDIYFNYSHDYGATWLIQDMRLDTDKSEAVYSQAPQITSDENGNVYVAWKESCGRPNVRDEDEGYYFNYSHDFGATWQAEDMRIDGEGGRELFYSYSPRISCDNNGGVYVVWSDTRPTGFVSEMNIFFNCSHNYGATWENYVQICTPAGHNGAPCINSDNNGNVYVVWSSNRNTYYDIYFNYSHDFGSTWQANEIRLDTNIPIPGERHDSIYQGISSDNNGNVYVSWSDHRNHLQNDVYFNYSHDFGATWQDSDIQIEKEPTQSFTNERSISCDNNGGVYIAWADRRNGPYSDIYFNYSQDFGVTWQSSDIRLDKDPPNDALSFYPQVSSDNNGNVYVVWLDNRNYNDKSIYPKGYYPADIYFTPINVRPPPELAAINDICVIQEGKTLELTITATTPQSNPLEILFNTESLPQDLQDNMANASVSTPIFNEETGETTARFSWIPAVGTAGDYSPVFIIAKDPISGKYAYQAITITVTPGPSLIANFEASPRSGDEVPLTVNFIDRSIGEIISWLWDFGDGTTSTEKNPIHTYTSYAPKGAYTVSLTVTSPEDSDTETKIDYIEHHLPPPPIADFTASPAKGEIPLTVEFTDLSRGKITSWLWDFGDGTTSIEENPSHTYTIPNTYTVSLTVTGPGGTDIETKVNLITIPPYDGIIRGRVYDAETIELLEGMEVTLKPHTYEDGLHDYTTTTDKNGNYEFVGVKKYIQSGDTKLWVTYRVYASSIRGYEDYISEELTFSETVGVLKCNLPLTPHSMIWGRVYDSITGEPLKEITVTLMKYGQYLYGTTTTDSNGNYEFTHVPMWYMSSGGGYWIPYKVSISEEGYEDYVSENLIFSEKVWHIRHDVALTSIPIPPEAFDQNISLDEDTSIDITLQATDPNGNPLTYKVLTLPSHGMLRGEPPYLTYTPVPNYYGKDSFTFKANDGTFDSNIATVLITIEPVNDPPRVSTIPGQIILQGERFANINLDDYVTDADTPDSQIWWEISPTTELDVYIDVGRVATITYPFNWTGSETVNFMATDPDGLSDSTQATFTVAKDSKELQNEIDLAYPGEEIPIEPGTYLFTSNLNIKKSITLKAIDPDPDNTIFILGDYYLHVKRPLPLPGHPLKYLPKVTIEGMTITGYNGTNENGPIQNYRTNLTLRNCKIIDNKGVKASAIYNSLRSIVNLENTLIAKNRNIPSKDIYQYGYSPFRGYLWGELYCGTIYLEWFSELYVNKSTIADNINVSMPITVQTGYGETAYGQTGYGTRKLNIVYGAIQRTMSNRVEMTNSIMWKNGRGNEYLDFSYILLWGQIRRIINSDIQNLGIVTRWDYLIDVIKENPLFEPEDTDYLPHNQTCIDKGMGARFE